MAGKEGYVGLKEMLRITTELPETFAHLVSTGSFESIRTRLVFE